MGNLMISSGEGRRTKRAPKGHIAVYVGEEKERFVVPISCLKNPQFQRLLEESAEVYGFRNEGGIIRWNYFELIPDIQRFVSTENGAMFAKRGKSFNEGFWTVPSLLEVMSTLGISEFEDSLWDEFFRVDQMVPTNEFECSNYHFPWHASLRNTHCAVNCNSSPSKDGPFSRCGHFGGKQDGCSSLHDKCSSISDTDSWSCKRSSVFPFPSESDLMDETSSVDFDDARPSCHAFKINSADSQGGDFAENGTYLGGRRTPVDNQSGITNQESAFDSFVDIDSTDFFSGVCPNIQSFEDVEMMFRSPGSTFGVRVEKDELSWLSPDNDGGCRSEFSCPKSSTDANMSEDRDSLKSYFAGDSAMMSAPIKLDDSSCTLDKSDSDIPFVNVPAIADSKGGFIPRDERVAINDTLGPSAHLQQRQKHALGLMNHMADAPLEKSHLPDQTPANQPSIVNCEGTDSTILSQMEFCNESSRLQSIDCFHGLTSSAASQAGIEKIEKQHNKQVNLSFVNESLNDANTMGRNYESDSRLVGKHVHLCEDMFEDPIDSKGVRLENPVKLGSSIEQETTMHSSDEISPEAASFCQLRLAVEWMDFKTRLSIRDGLYRLARGAEQRHNLANPGCGSCDGKDSIRSLIAEETNTCINFTNEEAGTNPIDRSIAHLLFHRPSDSCAIPAHDS
ncbi:hypothetical protein F511_14890 [Dorcoceras hygrometricum]|uniref:Uncharacterized protein n=1 Tax=Dorcoceras hygrometricum TaxID=472368 RepID=A0A2Z7BRT7_9LAMI|nr:hypothetical protein F511_14890 [Dorcoceras hygrometricum]